MDNETKTLIKYVFVSAVILLVMFILKPFFAFKPTDFISVKALHSVSLMIRGYIFFGLFFGIATTLISLSLNLKTKSKLIVLLLIIIPFSLFYKSMIGISFASGFLLSLILIVQFPPKLLIEDYKSFVSAIQFYNKSIIWKTYSFMFLFLVLFSILSKANYIDPVLDNVEKMTLEFTSGSIGKEIIAKTLSDQTGTQINPDDLSEDVVDQAMKQMEDMNSGIFQQARAIIESFPGANLIMTILIAGIVNASYVLGFLLALFVSFITTLILGNFVKDYYLENEKMNDKNTSTDKSKQIEETNNQIEQNKSSQSNTENINAQQLNQETNSEETLNNTNQNINQPNSELSFEEEMKQKIKEELSNYNN